MEQELYEKIKSHMKMMSESKIDMEEINRLYSARLDKLMDMWLRALYDLHHTDDEPLYKIARKVRVIPYDEACIYHKKGVIDYTKFNEVLEKIGNELGI